MKLLDRFWSKVDKRPKHWIWTAARHSQGYGIIWKDGKIVPAHRVAYEIQKGPIPPGYVVTQSCQKLLCMHPDHLEAMSKTDYSLLLEVLHFYGKTRQKPKRRKRR